MRRFEDSGLRAIICAHFKCLWFASEILLSVCCEGLLEITVILVGRH
jgi:hypothetical protein